MQKKDKHILWFDEVDKDDVGLVGGKGANLGEMASLSLPVPDGFIVTSKAYFDFLEENKLKSKLYQSFKSINVADPQQLNDVAKKTKKLILRGKISPQLAKEIINHYLKLGGVISKALVAIRSSATAEDLPTASFAGQQVTFLNVRGEANVVEKVKECWASLFEPRAIFYREEKDFDHFKVGMAVPIQTMVPSEVSGVMFTIDPITNKKNRIIIEAIYGLGEYIVQGLVTPDRYVVEKESLEILGSQIAKQTVQLVKAGSLNKKRPVPHKLQLKRKLTDTQIVELAKLGKKIHRHYFYPQDIEWALYKRKIHILQTRPVTTIKEVKVTKKIKRKIVLKGLAASPGMASGPVRIIKTPREIGKVKQGDILVSPMTSPDFVPAMKRAAAIVTDKGGQTSHAAIVSRELGIPCVVGCEKATEVLRKDQTVTVDGSRGEIYQGGMRQKLSILKSYPTLSGSPDEVKERLATNQLALGSVKTATKLYVNLAEPELADEIAKKNVDGVGLLRAEFMIAQIGAHPQKLIREKRQKEYITKLSDGLSKFCQAFYPRPVIYRSSDFKTNEYRHLVGGKAFEPEEENPFLGYRGAFRYIADPKSFELELEAIKKVRQKFNNLWLMIPFVRTLRELKEVKRIIVSQGLIRRASFKLWLMVEIPANVILLEEFIKLGIDGISIGSNDLTMLILGVDRDNTELAGVFDEQDPAVLWALERTIKVCRQRKITSSICGQAPSTHARLVELLVKWGITSISASPDAIDRTRELIYRAEEEFARKQSQ